MRRFTCALLGATALSFLAPASAQAAAFIIDDTLPTEQIVFTANDFEFGLTLDGNLFQQGTNNPAAATLPEADGNGNPIVHHFDGTWITTGAAMPPTRQVAFLEPLDGSLSDVLFVQYINQGNGLGRIVGSFVSDAGTGLNPSQYIDPLVPVTNWPESNGPFNFSAPFLTALANSDVDVPEPASFGLIAFGAGALGLRRRA